MHQLHITHTVQLNKLITMHGLWIPCSAAQHELNCFMQAEVQQALGNTYSAAAGKKMERWVHSRFTHLTHRLEQVCPQVHLGLNIFSFLVGFV